MRRISTTTAEADKHGTGKNGFTEGSAVPLVAPTQLSASMFDALQEEIARAVERDGQALDPSETADSYLQLHRAVSRNDMAINADFAISGFGVTEVGAPSLNGDLQPGVFYSGGRRYDVSDADIIAAGTERPRAYTASMITYLTAKPDPSDEAAFVFTAYEVALGTVAPPAVGADEAIISIVTTDGSEITSALGWIASSNNQAFPQPMFGPDGTMKMVVINPNANVSGIGDSDGNTLGGEVNDVVAAGRYWRRVYMQERYMRGLNGVGGSLGRVREWVRHSTITSAGANVSIDLGYTVSQPPDEAGLSVSCHVIATRTDVTTGQTKSWRMLRAFERDNAGVLTFAGAEIRQEVTASGNADVSFNVTGSIPSLELSVAGAGETWEFTCYIQTIISRF